MGNTESLRAKSIAVALCAVPDVREPRGMFNQHTREQSSAPQALRQRFLTSSIGALDDLKRLLIDAPAPIEPGTGAQIAQMLRAIREGASNHTLDRIAHLAESIETYLTSGETYVPGSELRNFVLSSQIDVLQRYFEEASAV